MKTSRLYRFLLPALCLLFTACEQLMAQNVVFTANASAQKIGVSDQLQVSYTLQDAQNIGSIKNPDFKDFKVIGGPFQSQSSNVSIIGNRMVQSRSFTVSFLLQARHTGSFIIGPAIADDGAGHSYQSNSLKIEVVPGSLQQTTQRMPSGMGFWDDDPFAVPGQRPATRQQQQAPQPKLDINDAVFIRVDVDKKAVKLGEQITALYKLYARIPMQVAISKLPSLNGFWTQDFTIPKQQKPGEEIINGQKYQTFVLKKSALFPQQAGKLVLDVAEAEGTAHVPVQTQRRSIFDDPFFQQAFAGTFLMSDPFFSDPFGDGGYEQVPLHLKSSPATINVSEIPEQGKPDGFTGAVGSFSINGKLSKETLSTDDVATLRLTITGSGNLKLFTAPSLHLPSGLDTYDPNVTDSITGRTTTISGEKVITYTIAPRAAGDYEIPPVTFSWYDPAQGVYQSASTPAYHLHVTPGKGLIAASPGAGKAGTSDIKDKLISFKAKPWVKSPIYWSMFAIPLLLLVGFGFYRKRQDETLEDAVLNRNRRASKVALKRLETAKGLLGSKNAGSFYEEISKALWLYISDKLNIPLSDLNKTTALESLKGKQINGELMSRLEKSLQECELALYTPAGFGHQMKQSFDEAASIITDLEHSLKS